MKHALDELQLQRLIDGELSARQRVELLDEIDALHAWRDVALAFVEDQVWKGQLRSTGGLFAASTTDADASDMSDGDRVEPPAVRDVASSAAGRFAGRRSGQSIGGRVWRSTWLSVALAVLAIAASFRLGALHQASGQVAQNGAARDSTGQPPSVRPADQTFANASQGYRLQFTSDNGEVVEFPIYDATDMQRASLIPERDGRVDMLNERLESLGYRLEFETEYLSGKLDDGQELVVPVQNVAMRYHGQ